MCIKKCIAVICKWLIIGKTTWIYENSNLDELEKALKNDLKG